MHLPSLLHFIDKKSTSQATIRSHPRHLFIIHFSCLFRGGCLRVWRHCNFAVTAFVLLMGRTDQAELDKELKKYQTGLLDLESSYTQICSIVLKSQITKTCKNVYDGNSQTNIKTQKEIPFILRVLQHYQNNYNSIKVRKKLLKIPLTYSLRETGLFAIKRIFIGFYTLY